jgi:fructose-1,6-bisphosphatase
MATNVFWKKILKNLHQRTPLFLGSSDMVEKAMEFMAKYTYEAVQK